MGVLQIIFLVIRFLPTMISLVNEIAKLIDRIKDKKKKQMAINDLRVSVMAARRGDHAPLKGLLKRLKECSDESCSKH